jgi:hypothetical protein
LIVSVLVMLEAMAVISKLRNANKAGDEEDSVISSNE